VTRYVVVSPSAADAVMVHTADTNLSCPV